MRSLFALTLAAAVTLASGPAAAAEPSQAFHHLMNDFWVAALRDSPLFASYAGVHDYDADLDVLSLAEMDRQAKEAEAFLTRLNSISPSELSAEDKTNYLILKAMLVNGIDANKFGERQMLYSSVSSYHETLAAIAQTQSFNTLADYENYLKRIALVPDRMRAYGDISLKAAREGYAQPCPTLAGFSDTIGGDIAPDPTRSRFFLPFVGQKPSVATDAQWADLKARASAMIRDRINPAYASFKKIYETQLARKCRNTLGISELPQGREYYAYLVRLYTTTTMTPEEIHQLGLSEVRRIRGDMDALATRSGYPSRQAMIADMRTNPAYFAKTPTELLAAAALMAKTLDGKMPRLFTRLPRLTYGIEPVPEAIAGSAPTARYRPGSFDAGVAGTYLVNTTKLDQRPLWELPVLTAHETVPGHHMQIATQQEMQLPDWRKYGAYFTAFIEGWGLYAESLGKELGIYDTPQKDMARLSYEMWRACRLVVDTGLHSKGWSKERAVAFLKENTALTDANIDAEVNRYITNPGQALAYKIGELRIRQLRARAEKELGDKFDLRRFNDAVIGQGSMPLDALATQINDWIAAEKRKPSAVGG